MKALLTILYLIFTTFGLSLMKIGGNSLNVNLKYGFSLKIGYLTLLGFFAYFISFILWQKMIVLFDLSYIVPLTTGIIQIIALVVGIVFFKETVNLYNIIGIILVIMGIVLLTIKK